MSIKGCCRVQQALPTLLTCCELASCRNSTAPYSRDDIFVALLVSFTR
jgi:hypothetical protein